MFSNNRVLVSLLFVSLMAVSVCSDASVISIDCGSSSVVINVSNTSAFITDAAKTTVHLGKVNQCEANATGENNSSRCVGEPVGPNGWKFILTSANQCDANITTTETEIRYEYTVSKRITPPVDAVVHRIGCLSTKVACTFKRSYNLTHVKGLVPGNQKTETNPVVSQFVYGIEFGAFTSNAYNTNVTSVVSTGTPIYMQAKFKAATVNSLTKIGLKDCFVSPFSNASNVAIKYDVLDSNGCVKSLSWDDANARSLIKNSQSKEAQFSFKSFTWVTRGSKIEAKMFVHCTAKVCVDVNNGCNNNMPKTVTACGSTVAAMKFRNRYRRSNENLHESPVTFGPLYVKA